MTLRRRIAGFILVAGAVFIGLRFFGSSDELAHVKIVYRLPDGVTSIEAVVLPPDSSEPVARFESRLVQGEARQDTRLAPGPYTVRVTLGFAVGRARVTRSIEAKDDAEVTVDLRDVRPDG